MYVNRRRAGVEDKPLRRVVSVEPTLSVHHRRGVGDAAPCGWVVNVPVAEPDGECVTCVERRREELRRHQTRTPRATLRSSEQEPCVIRSQRSSTAKNLRPC